MVYLIGGVPRVGKSMLASLILERNRISAISTDVIRNLLDFSPTKTGILELDEHDRPEAFYPYLYKLIRILDNEYTNFVVEGDIFTPLQVTALQERVSLRCCFLGATRLTLDYLMVHDTQSSWLRRLGAEEQAQAMEKIVQESRMLEVEAPKCGFSYVDVFPDHEAALEKAYRELVG